MRSHEWSNLLAGRDASGIYGIQMFGIRREQGRLAELAPVIRVLGSQDRSTGPWRPGLVSVLVELGMDTEARRELARVAADGLDGFRERLWIASLTYLTDACTALGDEATAALVYPELEPLAGHGRDDRPPRRRATARPTATSACSPPRWANGTAPRSTSSARRSSTGEMGMVTWLAHTLYQRARALQARGDGAARGAVPRRGGGARRATAGCRRCSAGSGRSERRRRPPSLPDGLSSREVQILVLVARGLSNREIGGTLSISEHTAANHIRSILRKTSCANRTQAASYAHRHGLVEV